MPSVIRVFPRRTSLTPTDELAFVGDPPLFRPEAGEVHVSVAFTWDAAEGQRIAEAWSQYYPIVKLGGPAMGSPANGFTPGLYVREGVTFTSRGCNKRCPWCLVPKWEGKIALLPIAPGWVVQDNNLLQCPREHQVVVYEMLRKQRKAAKFSGGLDATLVDDWVADQLRTVPIHEVFLAADTEASLKPLQATVERLSFLRRNQLRCYVLIGFNGETLAEARDRLEAVWAAGCLPFAQLYRPPDRPIRYSLEWRTLARTWSRPAAMVAEHNRKGGRGCNETVHGTGQKGLDIHRDSGSGGRQRGQGEGHAGQVP